MKKIGIAFLFMTFVMILIGSVATISEINQFSQGPLARNIAISPDDKKIAYSYREDGGNLAIFTANLDGTGIEKISQPTDDEFHRVQSYSSDGSKILYLSYKKGAEKPTSYLYEIDVKSGNKKQITTADQHVSEAIYGLDDKKIFFLKSGIFVGYSAPAYPHDFDVYSINVDSTSEKKITELKNYQLRNLSLNNSGTKLYFTGYYGEEVEKGVTQSDVIYELDLETKLLKYSIPKSSKLTNLDPISSAQISKSGALVFVTPDPDVKGVFSYELFGMNIKSSVNDDLDFSLPATQITKNKKMVLSPRFFNHSNELLLIQDKNYGNSWNRNEHFQLLRVNLGDFKITEISLGKTR